jgi:hypothetical protein
VSEIGMRRASADIGSQLGAGTRNRRGVDRIFIDAQGPMATRAAQDGSAAWPNASDA